MVVVLPARFVQTITQENINELSIPPDFTRKLLNLEAEARVRRADTHRIWTVEVLPCIDARGKTHYRLAEGWGQAVEENGIVVGEFLVFEYCGNSVFTITVYAPSGVIRPLAAGENPQAGPRRVRGRRPLFTADDESAIAGSTYLAYSRFPHFLVVLTPGYIQTSKPNVTLSFALQHLADRGDSYGVLDVRGAEYLVTFSGTHRAGRIVNCHINDGFRDVIRGARLRTGHVLAFELIEVTDPFRKFKITVFGNP